MSNILNIKTEAAPAQAREIVGRKYETIRYGLYSRLIGGDGNWYGAGNYRTEKEAIAAMQSMGGRYQAVGGITVEFGKEARGLYEYRVVRIVSQNEVLLSEIRAI